MLFPCIILSIIRYGSRLCEAIQGKQLWPSLHLGVVAIEMGAFGLALLWLANSFIMNKTIDTDTLVKKYHSIKIFSFWPVSAFSYHHDCLHFKNRLHLWMRLKLMNENWSYEWVLNLWMRLVLVNERLVLVNETWTCEWDLNLWMRLELWNSMI